MTALELIAKERERQRTKEGWSDRHDDKYENEELARAATLYVMPSFWRITSTVQSLWPWHSDWWKPTSDNRIKELVKAGALIVAEIERIQRREQNDSILNG